MLECVRILSKARLQIKFRTEGITITNEQCFVNSRAFWVVCLFAKYNSQEYGTFVFLYLFCSVTLCMSGLVLWSIMGTFFAHRKKRAAHRLVDRRDGTEIRVYKQ